MRYFLILFVFLLSSCAAAIQVGPAAPDPTPTLFGDGEIPANEILITRENSLGLVTNVATNPLIYIEDKKAGRCAVGKPLLLRVPDGEWTITARTDAGEVSRTVTVADGQTQEMTCGTTGLRPRPVLELAPEV